jgi:hypothetical protein
MKKFLLIILIIALGTFIYLKVQVNGDENSKFNQTTRFSLGKNGVIRAILGLHLDGDARAEYLENKNPLVIEWFKPVSQDVDEQPIIDFANLIAKYTGRQTKVVFGSRLSDGTIKIPDLASYNLKAEVDGVRSGSTFAIFFTDDYSPRPDEEISSTFKESAMLISISGHRDFLKGYSQSENQYYLSTMLHEFGHQIGLVHNDDSSCIMNTHAGIEGQPLEYYGRTEPQDFCPMEKEQIEQLKLMYR